MKQVSLQDLKQHLSELVNAAAEGEQIVITRHNRPIAELSAYRERHVWTGKNFGKARITPLFTDLPKDGRILEILAEDREDRF